MDEKIEVVASGAIKELKELKAALEDTIKPFIELNNLARNSELKLKTPKGSYSELNKDIQENANAMKMLGNVSAELWAQRQKYLALEKAEAKEGLAIQKAVAAEEKRIVKEKQDSIKAIDKASRDSAKQQTQDRKNQIALEKAEAKEIKNLEKAVAALEKQMAREAAAAKITEGTIAYARQQVSLLTKERDLLNITTEKGAIRQQELNKQIDQYNNFVKINVSSLEQQRLNIGNYASGNVELRRQLGFLISELPNAAISFRTFTTAISNNLLGLGQSIALAREENKKFAAEGKATIPIWKQVATSIISWQTALAALSGLFITYGDRILGFLTNAAYKAKQAALENIGLKNSIDGVIASYQGLEKEISRIERYNLAYAKSIGATDEGLIAIQQKYNKERIDGLEEYRKKLADERKYADDALRIRQAGGIYGAEDVKTAIEAISKIEKAQIDNSETLTDLYIQRDILDLNLSEARRKREEEELGEKKKRNKKARESAEEEARKEYEFNLKLLNDMRKNAQKMYAGIRSGFGGMSFDILRPDINSKDVMPLFEQDVMNNERFMFSELIALNKQYQDGTITNQEVFEKKRTEIIRKWTIERLRIELKAAEQSAQSLTGDDRVKALNQVASINKQISDLEVEQFTTANENKIRNLNDFLTRYKEVMSEVLNFSSQISKSITENELGELQKRKAQIDIDFANRKTQLAADFTTRAEYEQKISALEAQRAQDLEQIRLDEIKTRQRQAIFDKAAAIAQATINTALVVTQLGLITPAAIAAAAVGAAQVAAIIATPLPQYAKGTDNHPGGAFIAAEGNKPEILQNPDGSMSLLSKEGIYTAPAHARVIPQNEWATKLPFLSERLIKSMQHQQQIKTDKMESYLASIDYKIGRINRPTTQKKGILLPSQRKSMN